MARERTRTFVTDAQARRKSDPIALTAALETFMPQLTALAEQATADEANLHLAELTDGDDGDDGKLRGLCERANQKLGAIRREQGEIVKRLRRVVQARREYDAVLADIAGQLGAPPQ